MTHAVVFVHGWNGIPWAERFIKAVPEWADSTYLPYSWGLPSKEMGVVVAKWMLTHFNEAKERTLINGVYLSRMLNLLNVDSIDIVGHSMGAHVVFEALNQAITAPINNVYLFAGALPRAKSWHRAASQIQGRIFNFSSEHDRSLQAYCAYLSTSTKYNGGTIGLPIKGSSEASKGISTRLSKVHNIDTSHMNLGHNDYHPRLRELIEKAHSIPARETQDSTWQSSFYWDPVPQLHVSGTKNVRGVKTEIIQAGLKKHFLHKHSINITGFPDETTVQLVKRFQTEHGLKADGIVGPQTWALLVNRPIDWIAK